MKSYTLDELKMINAIFSGQGYKYGLKPHPGKEREAEEYHANRAKETEGKA